MKILFVHNSLRTFVRLDRDVLATSHDVHELNYHWNTRTFGSLIRQIQDCDLIFAWFASYHSFLPAILGKRHNKIVVVCSSDYDLANELTHGYGSMRGGLSKRINNQIFSVANCVIVPSEFSHHMALTNTVLGKMSEKVITIPHGIPLTKMPTKSKQARAITVATLHKLTNWRKGVNTFVQTASHLPAIGFDVVGSALDNSLNDLKQQASANVVFHGQLSDVQRDELLARAQVYAQLSFIEGFGLSLAEAMLQECVPVVTRRGALPEVVGDCGVYVEYNNSASAAEGIRYAMTVPELGKMARERVHDLFSLELRAQRLNQVLASL